MNICVPPHWCYRFIILCVRALLALGSHLSPPLPPPYGWPDSGRKTKHARMTIDTNEQGIYTITSSRLILCAHKYICLLLYIEYRLQTQWSCARYWKNSTFFLYTLLLFFLLFSFFFFFFYVSICSCLLLLFLLLFCAAFIVSCGLIGWNADVKLLLRNTPSPPHRHTKSKCTNARTKTREREETKRRNNKCAGVNLSLVSVVHIQVRWHLIVTHYHRCPCDFICRCMLGAGMVLRYYFVFTPGLHSYLFFFAVVVVVAFFSIGF